MVAARGAARAIDALRRGWPIAVDGVPMLAIETADDARLETFDPDRTANVLLSSGRATTLRLTNQLAAADPDRPVLVARAPWIDIPMATALADPALDLTTPFKGPLRAVPLTNAEPAAAALRIARLAGLLPAFFVGGRGPEVSMSSTDVDAYEDADLLVIATRAKLPVEGAGDAEIIAFRSFASAEDHVALVIGQPNGTVPIVRLHSECLTGDVFSSLKCDCGPQLHTAIRAIATSGWGMLLYLRQEGRGIGLVNKLRAYALQDQGFDTVDANTRLGFAVDARDFGLAARMLTLLGQRCIRLLTNNPAKVCALEARGIIVDECVPHALPPNMHNARYLATKRDRTGHQL